MPNSVVQGRGTLADVVLEEARGHDRTLAKLVTAEERRRALPLAGVTLGVKDNICAAGFRATAGSLALSRYAPPRDATVVDNLRRAGCVVVGKTLCDEFGMGSTTESSASQLKDVVGGAATTRNPWDLSRVPGGSSGGSAAAVSSRQCALALGTDNVVFDDFEMKLLDTNGPLITPDQYRKTPRRNTPEILGPTWTD